MKRILHHYRIVPDFLDILFQFGYRPSVFQHNSNNLSFRRFSDGSYSMIRKHSRAITDWQAQGLCYSLTYVEANGKPPPSDPVSRRQTGVFHRYDTKSKNEVIICLHPMQDSKAEQHLNRLSCKRSSRNPLDLHCAIISSYLPNWGSYVESLAVELTSLVSRSYQMWWLVTNSKISGRKFLLLTSRGIIPFSGKKLLQHFGLWRIKLCFVL